MLETAIVRGQTRSDFIQIYFAWKSDESYDFQGRAQSLGNADQYRLRWDKLKICSAMGIRCLSFSDIPWPTKTRPSKPPDITKGTVKSFLESLDLMSNSKECVLWIRKELLRWHPDKFSTTVLPIVYEDQEGQVQEGVNNVSGILTALMNEARSPA